MAEASTITDSVTMFEVVLGGPHSLGDGCTADTEFVHRSDFAEPTIDTTGSQRAKSSPSFR
jgi:hypothetical protein